MASPISSKYPQLHEFYVQNCLLSAIEDLKWRDCPGDIVMDVGCVYGTISSQYLAAFFPNVRKIVVTNPNSYIVEVTKLISPHPKIDYCVADIEDSSTLSVWMGKITKLFSANSFTYLSDQDAAFENLYKLMAPGGEAAIRFCLQSFYFDAYMDLVEQARWKKYLQLQNIRSAVPESHSKKYDASHYSKLLQEIGFEVVLCQEEDKKYLFQSQAVCRNAITNSLLVDLIPKNQRKEFKEAMFETFIKHSKGSREHPRLNYKVLTVLVRKSKTVL